MAVILISAVLAACGSDDQDATTITFKHRVTTTSQATTTTESTTTTTTTEATTTTTNFEAFCALRSNAGDAGCELLDEISELYPELQVKLLRVLEERQVMRVGGSELIDVDFRLIAATNRDLEKEVSEGRFREDLYYRLKVVTLRIPPLRERPGDIPQLAEHFLALFCQEHGKPPKRLSPEALEMLARYPWPGNVRAAPERHRVVGGLPSGRGDRAGRPAGRGARVSRRGRRRPAARCSRWSGEPRTMAEIERQAILETLQRTGGHRAKAADLLGIGLRTLQRKLKEYKDERLLPGLSGRRRSDGTTGRGADPQRDCWASRAATATLLQVSPDGYYEVNCAFGERRPPHAVADPGHRPDQREPEDATPRRTWRSSGELAPPASPSTSTTSPPCARRGGPATPTRSRRRASPRPRAPPASPSTCAWTAATSRTATSSACARASRGKLNLEMATADGDGGDRPARQARPGDAGARAARGGHHRGRARPRAARPAGRRGGRAARAAGIAVSLFLDPDPRQIEALAGLAERGSRLRDQHRRLHPRRCTPRSPPSSPGSAAAAAPGRGRGFHVYAGHGLTTANVGAIAALPGMEELNIGHSIVSRAVLVGMEAGGARDARGDAGGSGGRCGRLRGWSPRRLRPCRSPSSSTTTRARP